MDLGLFLRACGILRLFEMRKFLKFAIWAVVWAAIGLGGFAASYLLSNWVRQDQYGGKIGKTHFKLRLSPGQSLTDTLAGAIGESRDVLVCARVLNSEQLVNALIALKNRNGGVFVLLSPDVNRDPNKGAAGVLSRAGIEVRFTAEPCADQFIVLDRTRVMLSSVGWDPRVANVSSSLLDYTNADLVQQYVRVFTDRRKTSTTTGPTAVAAGRTP